MKKLALSFSAILFFSISYSQLTTTPSGGNKKAWTGEMVGLTDVQIQYSRPGVKGREGKIWGGLVQEGFFKPDFGSNTSTPWRAGANENTVISFSNDVNIEGKKLPAGTYGLFIAYKPDESVVIFSKNSTSWGSYYYNENEDALRVNVKPVNTDRMVERLAYEFTDQTDSSAIIQLVWEKKSIPFKVSVDLTNDQIASFRKELRGAKGFGWQPFAEAAQWCAQRKVNLGEALLWADSASGPTFGGDTQFQPWAVKSQVLMAQGKDAEAAEAMKKGLPFAGMQDIHQYGRQLVAARKNKEALEIFKLNASKHPKEFTTYVGLARGYSANGDYKNALKNAQLALPLSPDNGNRQNIEAAIVKLKQGQDIN